MKISQEIKSRIIKEVVNKTLAKKREKLAAEENRLATLIYELLYPVSIQAVMKTLPDLFFSKGSHVFVKIGNCDEQFHLECPRSLASNDAMNWHRPLIAWEELTEKEQTQVNKYIGGKALLQKLKDDLTKKVNYLLMSVNTQKQLEDTWPEGKKFYAQFFRPVPIENPPAIIVSDLDNLITTLSKEGE